MILGSFAKQVEKFLQDNSPAVLTAIGVTGTVSTAYLTGAASFKASNLLRSEQGKNEVMTHEGRQPYILDNREKFQLVWKEYIPAAGVGILTITCIITANRIGTRRAAAMAAAYGLSEKAFVEYKEKVVDKIGENKERAIRDEIAQDQVNRTPPTGEQVIVGDGKVLCFDSFSGRYFRSTVEDVKKAMNDTNYEMIHNMYTSLNDFYSRLGLEPVEMGEELGWNSDHLMEVLFSTTLADDNTPCIVTKFHVEPIRRYYKSG